VPLFDTMDFGRMLIARALPIDSGLQKHGQVVAF
jgi:hypothetical protein